MVEVRITFTIDGKQMNLTDKEVVRKLKKVKPEGVNRHAVEIGDKLFPMKQAFAVATGLDRLDFTTNQARRTFKRLGFEVHRVR